MQDEESRKTVKTFYLASFLNDLGSDMIYPVWPLFVTSILGADMVFLGFLDGVGEAVTSFSQVGSGLISDRLQKRKIFIWTGYVCAALSRVGYGLSASPLRLLPFRLLDRFGKMRAAPRDAMIADLSTRETRGSSFGMLRALDNLGAVCGILTCIALINDLGYRNLFFLAAVPSLIGAIFIFFLIEERKTTDVYVKISFRELSPHLKLFFLISAFFALGAFSYSFLLIFAKESGTATTFVPVLYLVFTATASVTSYPFGRLADRIGRKQVVITAFALFGLMCGGFILKMYIPFLVVVYGLHKGALDPVQKTVVAELAPASRRASILGAYQMMLGVCALLSSVVAGVLWETYGMIAPFVFSLATSGGALALMLFLQER